MGLPGDRGGGLGLIGITTPSLCCILSGIHCPHPFQGKKMLRQCSFYWYSWRKTSLKTETDFKDKRHAEFQPPSNTIKIFWNLLLWATRGQLFSQQAKPGQVTAVLPFWVSTPPWIPHAMHHVLISHGKFWPEFGTVKHAVQIQNSILWEEISIITGFSQMALLKITSEAWDFTPLPMSSERKSC